MADADNDFDYVRSLTSNTRILEFCAFLIEERGDNLYPRYNIRKLMSIPHLVPNIFAFDYRNGIKNGMMVAHSGTNIDKEYGFNLSGDTIETYYTGDDNREDVLNGYRRSYREKKKFYSRRAIHIKKNRWDPHHVAESLLFPCSENQIDIDFGWGMVLFGPADETVENVFRNW